MINFIAKKTLQFLRTAVVLGIMAMLLQANYCTEKLPGDDVAEPTSAQEDASAAGTDTKAKAKDGDEAKGRDEGKTKGDLELGDECDGDELCASGNCGDDNLCAAAKSKMSLRMKLLILETAIKPRPNKS